MSIPIFSSESSSSLLFSSPSRFSVELTATPEGVTLDEEGFGKGQEVVQTLLGVIYSDFASSSTSTSNTTDTNTNTPASTREGLDGESRGVVM